MLLTKVMDFIKFFKCKQHQFNKAESNLWRKVFFKFFCWWITGRSLDLGPSSLVWNSVQGNSVAIIQGITAQCAEQGHKDTAQVFPQLKPCCALGLVPWACAGDSPPAFGCTCPQQLIPHRAVLTALLCPRAAVMGALCSGTHPPSQEPNFPLLFLFLLPVPSWAGWFCFYGFTFTKPLLQYSHQVAIKPEITLLLNTNDFVFLKGRALKVLSQEKKIFVGSAEASPGCLTPISLFGELVIVSP